MKLWIVLSCLFSAVAPVAAFRLGSRALQNPATSQPGIRPASRLKFRAPPSTLLRLTPLCASADDDAEEADAEHTTSNALRAFQLSLNNTLTPAALVAWEVETQASAAELRTLTDSQTLYAVYLDLLKATAPLTLDPLQFATFDLLSGAVIDALLKVHPKGMPITPLIDEITEVHLRYVDAFRDVIDDGGSDGYSQSANMEFLCYQFAGLVNRLYGRISRGLGADFDSSRVVVDMRTSNWVSPIYARLQRRFVRFTAGEIGFICGDFASFC